MDALQAKWQSLSAGARRMVVIGAIGLTVAGLIAVASPSRDSGAPGGPAAGRQETIKHVLTDTDPREVGIDSINANVRDLQAANRELTRQIEAIREQLGRTEQLADRKLRTQVASLSRKLEDARAEQDRMRGRTRLAGTGVVPPVQQLRQEEAAELFEAAPVPRLFDAQDAARPPGQNGGGQGHRPGPMEIRVVSARGPEPALDEEEAPAQPYLPAGTIITGTLLTGLDAPTGQGGSSDPTPALVRIAREAILPSRYTSDIRDCFIVMSGYGDLSAERAYLRGETLSCITEHGQVLETRLRSYAAGEDGKAGIRGRLVSKQGTLLARAMLAGFADGFARMFSVTPVPVLQTGQPGTSVGFQDFLSPQALQGAAIGGASQALNRLADYYMDMADQLYPVIEVDSGRTIDVIVTKGAALPIVKGAGMASR